MLPNDKNHPMNQPRLRTADINNDIRAANLRAHAAYQEKLKRYNELKAKNTASGATKRPTDIVSKATNAVRGLFRMGG